MADVAQQRPGLVLVTGGSRGIGAATALAAARRGWSVLLTYVRDHDSAHAVADRCKGSGVTAAAVRFDAADLDAVPQLFDEVDRFDTPLRGLVNNVGIATPISPVAEMTDARLAHTMLVNAISPMVIARHALQRMAVSRGGGGGAIVNVSSRLSELGAPGRQVDYAASKAAIDGFTRGLGREVAADGVRVNAVRPGVIDTEIHASVGEAGRVQEMAAMIPMGRAGRADEVADVIVWLLSQESSYVSASLVEVSGGR